MKFKTVFGKSITGTKGDVYDNKVLQENINKVKSKHLIILYILLIGLFIVIERFTKLNIGVDNLIVTIIGIGIGFHFLKKKINLRINKKKLTPIIEKHFGGEFKYSVYGEYGCTQEEIEDLKKKDIVLKGETKTMEDSIQYTVHDNGKLLGLKGSEITIEKGSGKNKITQDIYVIKIEYQNTKLESKGIIHIKHRNKKIFSDIFGKIGKSIFGNNNRQEEIKFFQEGFNKLYQVKSNDQVFARYIIDPVFMEKLIKFGKERNNIVEFYFENKCIYILIHSQINGDGEFLDPIYKTEEELEKKIIAELQSLIDITKELNLIYFSKINYSQQNNQKISQQQNIP